MSVEVANCFVGPAHTASPILVAPSHRVTFVKSEVDAVEDENVKVRSSILIASFLASYFKTFIKTSVLPAVTSAVEGADASLTTVKEPAVFTDIVEPVEVVMVSVIACPVVAPTEFTFAAAALVPHAWVLSAAADEEMLHFRSIFFTVPFGITRLLVRVKVMSLSVSVSSDGFLTSVPVFNCVAPSYKTQLLISSPTVVAEVVSWS